MSALDRNLREQTRQELLRVQRETGTTFVLVTHDQDEALAMATRIGLLHQGRLAQVGPPAEIYERPASRYVAAFMGGANILAATVRDAGPDAVLDVQGVGPVQASGPAPVSGALHIALRPERLRLNGNGANRAAGNHCGGRLPRRRGGRRPAPARWIDPPHLPAPRRRNRCRAPRAGSARRRRLVARSLRDAPLMRRLGVLAPVWLWLLLFVAAPVLIVAALSFSTSVADVPPFTPLLRNPDPANYAALTEDAFYLDAALKSLLVAGVASALCLLIGYPMALAIVRAGEKWRSLLLLLVMLPFWTGFLLRVTA